MTMLIRGNCLLFPKTSLWWNLRWWQCQWMMIVILCSPLPETSQQWNLRWWRCRWMMMAWWVPWWYEAGGTASEQNDDLCNSSSPSTSSSLSASSSSTASWSSPTSFYLPHFLFLLLIPYILWCISQWFISAKTDNFLWKMSFHFIPRKNETRPDTRLPQSRAGGQE